MVHKDNDKIIDMRDKLMNIISPDRHVPIREAKAKNICAKCGKDAIVFTDTLSKREYGITQWCQICQDEFF
jgi:predicted RNA-binding Zn-ribbon protein involved in translation (DUF1610 family)